MEKWEQIYARLIADPRYATGITYGKPRKGHIEGTVRNHLIDLDANLDRLKPLHDEQYWMLKVLVHVHDTFKYWAKRDSSIEDPESHASLARKFLAEFTTDQDALEMVQYHDENFSMSQRMRTKGKYDEGRFRKNILDRIADIDTFLLFTLIDGYTPGKMRDAEKLRWFVEEVAKHRPVGQQVYLALQEFGL